MCAEKLRSIRRPWKEHRKLLGVSVYLKMYMSGVKKHAKFIISRKTIMDHKVNSISKSKWGKFNMVAKATKSFMNNLYSEKR